MAVIPIRTGGGADTSFVTAIASDIRQGKVGVDANGDPVNGTLTAAGVVSGNKALSSAEGNQFSIDVTEYATVSISGVGGSFVGSGITRQAAKTVPPLTTEQTAVNSGVFTTGVVKVGAIPNQKSDSGNVTLTSGAATKSYAAGYYANAHGATVPVYTGG